MYLTPSAGQIAAALWIGLILSGFPAAVPAASDPAPTGIPWEAPLGRDHPLTGRIWDVAAGRFIDEETLLGRLAPVRFVLAGESHNNPDHHHLQLRILQALVASGRRPAVGFELFTSADQPELDRYRAAHPPDPAVLLEGLGWSPRRRALWELYLPLVRFVGEARLPLVAMDLSREEIAALKRDGLDALPRELVAGFALNQPLPGNRQQTLVDDLVKGHCGLLFSQDLEGPLLVQRVRDATMAQRLERSDAGDGALMLSGYGHARNDRGVPFLLHELRREGALISLLFASVKADLTQPLDYAAWFGAETLPFDYAWFTPRVDDEDPCERLKRIYRRRPALSDAEPPG